MKKQVIVLLEFESDNDTNLSDDFIMHDLIQEISCASNDYEIIDIKTHELT